MPTYKRVSSDNSPPVEGGGPVTPPYIHNFSSVDWTLASPYASITVPAATHLKGLTPTAEVFEIISFNLEKVQTEVIMNASGDITIQIQFVPDLRFSGKLIIS